MQKQTYCRKDISVWESEPQQEDWEWWARVDGSQQFPETNRPHLQLYLFDSVEKIPRLLRSPDVTPQTSLSG